jgi:putative FmdB family regulatory protein
VPRVVASRHPEVGRLSVFRDREPESGMPRYEFLCEKCKKPFELIMTISEREKTKPTCPKCKGTKIVPQFGGFMAQTAKKS